MTYAGGEISTRGNQKRAKGCRRRGEGGHVPLSSPALHQRRMAGKVEEKRSFKRKREVGKA